jgi:tRNA threonylcarbamoyl adenosine modification protein (Sua5/YciO/YrdC/YwlC family)
MPATLNSGSAVIPETGLRGGASAECRSGETRSDGDGDVLAAPQLADSSAGTPEIAESFRGKGMLVPSTAAGAVGMAADILREGGVVALPTDTLYGLAGLCTKEAPIERIYEIKGRDRKIPLALCIAEASDVPAYGQCEHLPAGLLDALLPGPVSVVLQQRKGSIVARNLNPGRATVALRVPDSRFIQAVCRQAGVGLVLTSANASGEASTVAVQQFSGLWPHLDAVFDGGRIDGDPLGSTIVDLSSADGYVVLRDGSALLGTEGILAYHGLRRLPIQCGPALAATSD